MTELRMFVFVNGNIPRAEKRRLRNSFEIVYGQWHVKLTLYFNHLRTKEDMVFRTYGCFTVFQNPLDPLRPNVA